MKETVEVVTFEDHVEIRAFTGNSIESCASVAVENLPQLIVDLTAAIRKSPERAQYQTIVAFGGFADGKTAR